MRSPTPFLGLLALLCAAAACSSPPPSLVPEGLPEEPAQPLPPPSLKELDAALSRERDYPLYPGDTIRIQVQGHEDLTVEREIPPDGRIPLYGVDVAGPGGEKVPAVVIAAGKRVSELEEELKEHYGRLFSPPYVTVRVTSYAEKVIYITGAVSSPGRYVIPNQRRISLVKALATAGWFTEDAATDRVRVMREDPRTGKPVPIPPIDVARISAEGRLDRDLLLEPGDTINVESLESLSVYITGHVQQPGEYRYIRGLTLVKLISIGGGLRTFAKFSNIKVIRGAGTYKAKTFVIDLDSILDGESPDFPLEPGDRVYIDERFI
jgi:polysaccharide export outer membrane protein